jgi:hypothetical protein
METVRFLLSRHIGLILILKIKKSREERVSYYLKVTSRGRPTVTRVIYDMLLI